MVAELQIRFFFFNQTLIFFTFLHENIPCGYSLEVPHWGASNEYPQDMFSWQNKRSIFLIAPLSGVMWMKACSLIIIFYWAWEFYFSLQNCNCPILHAVNLQWLEHRWLIYHGWFELIFESVGNSSDSSRKQIFMDILWKFSYFIIKIYVVCIHCLSRQF